jgi:hypothetical protein
MFARSKQTELIRSSGASSTICVREISPIALAFRKFRSLSRTAPASGFFDHAIDKRIACPYKFSKRSGVKTREDDLGGSVRRAASVASTLPRMSTDARPLHFDNAGAARSKFGRRLWNGCPTGSMAPTPKIIVSMKFDRTVGLPKRGHGIEVRIH